MTPSVETLRELCRQVRLPTAASVVGERLTTAACENWSLEAFLTHLVQTRRGEVRGWPG